VRLGFIVASSLQGFGLMLYAVLWIVVPPDHDPRSFRLRANVGRILVFIAAAIFVVATLSAWHGSTQVVVIIFAGIVVVGAAFTWQCVDPAQPPSAATSWWDGAFAEGGRPTVTLLRWVGGGALVAAGLTGLLIVSGELRALRSGLIFAVTVLAGLAIVLGPWLLRTLSSLRAERYARIRSQERAELAAVVHDKVMHTLALIQRRSGDAREITRLARGQERELRRWLYQAEPSPNQQLSTALEEVAAEVEDTYAVTVGVVVVGDGAVSEARAALVAAIREALINAAKHSGVSDISVYAEVETGESGAVTAYVRDRGTGFSLAEIPADRHGVHRSIMERMLRHGGQAHVRTAAGQGTEVRLEMPMGSPRDPKEKP
jgi:signal transduction histidine kinase